MKISIKILLGILILLQYSCQEKALISDYENMHLKGKVELVFEQTLCLYPIEHSGRKLNETINHLESDYWKFTQTGNIIEHGHLIASEDSLYHIENYSILPPHGLEQMIHCFSDVDTAFFYEIITCKLDTTYKKVFFADSTLFRSEIHINDKLGREVESIIEFPPSIDIKKSYYPTGLIKEEIISNSLTGINKIKYEYNEQNFKTKEIFYVNNIISSKSDFEYTLDRNKNWITQTEYVNEEPVQIKIRNIKYYKNDNR